MLRFFRTIRKKLIEEDNVRKYLLYAVGEIFLVVIGILIALQVNNWNEGRKDQMKVTNYLSSLSSELQQNLTFLEEKNREIHDDSLALADIKIRLKSDKANADTLKQIMKNEFNNRYYLISGLNMSTFNSLESTGDIGLLEQWLVKDLQSLSFKIEDLITVTEKLSNQWADDLYEYYSQFPSPESMGQENFILSTQSNKVWEQADTNTLALYSNMILESKEASTRSILPRSIPLERSIRNLLKKIHANHPKIMAP